MLENIPADPGSRRIPARVCIIDTIMDHSHTLKKRWIASSFLKILAAIQMEKTNSKTLENPFTIR